MPAIAMCYGIIIYMYFMDNKQHNAPHIHVKYQGYKVIVSIPEGDVLEGSIPNAKMKLLQARCLPNYFLVPKNYCQKAKPSLKLPILKINHRTISIHQPSCND